MVVTITVPPQYGYVVLVALGVLPLLSYYHGHLVGPLRKKSPVFPPHAYATPEQCAANPAAYQLNCAVRAHGNYLENSPQTMLFLLVAGLKWPLVTAGLGVAWAVCRVLFLYGYIYGTKERGMGRIQGAGFWLVQLILMGMTATVGVGMITSV